MEKCSAFASFGGRTFGENMKMELLHITGLICAFGRLTWVSRFWTWSEKGNYGQRCGFALRVKHICLINCLLLYSSGYNRRGRENTPVLSITPGVSNSKCQPWFHRNYKYAVICISTYKEILLPCALSNCRAPRGPVRVQKIQAYIKPPNPHPQPRKCKYVRPNTYNWTYATYTSTDL